MDIPHHLKEQIAQACPPTGWGHLYRRQQTGVAWGMLYGALAAGSAGGMIGIAGGPAGVIAGATTGVVVGVYPGFFAGYLGGTMIGALGALSGLKDSDATCVAAQLTVARRAGRTIH